MKNNLSILILACIVATLVIATHARNETWKSEVSLWTDCVKKSPNKGRPYENLGAVLYRQGKKQEGLSLFAKAVEVEPDSARLNWDYGALLLFNGRAKESVWYFEKVILLNRDFVGEAKKCLAWIRNRAD